MFGRLRSLGDSSFARRARRKFGRQRCPTCGRRGSLRLRSAAVEVFSGARPTLTRHHRCLICGTAIREERVAFLSPHGARRRSLRP